MDGALRPAPIRNKVCDWLGKKNNRDGHITMPLSLKTIIDSTGYRDQQNERFGWVQVTRTTPESGLKKDAVLSGLIHRFPSKRKAESCRKKSR